MTQADLLNDETFQRLASNRDLSPSDIHRSFGGAKTPSWSTVARAVRRWRTSGAPAPRPASAQADPVIEGIMWSVPQRTERRTRHFPARVEAMPEVPNPPTIVDDPSHAEYVDDAQHPTTLTFFQRMKRAFGLEDPRECFEPSAGALVERSIETPVEAPAALAPVIEVHRTESPTSGTATLDFLTSERVTTLEQLLAVAEVDTSVWEVERWEANKWEVGAKGPDKKLVTSPLFQVKAKLRRIKGLDNLQTVRDAILAEIAAHAPVYPTIKRPAALASPYMLEVAAFDLHVGKLAWGEEVDAESYDSSHAERILMAAIEDLLRKASGFEIERILFPVGNDLIHSDNPEGTTTSGTRQDVDTRHSKMFRRAWQLMVSAIDRLRLVAPVDVIIVPGNHDRDSAFKLGELLFARYEGCPDVTVDSSATLRKYIVYGATLLGFTHGSDERHSDLPLIMASERPHEWAATEHHEFHLGHYHIRRETRYNVGDTYKGVTVRILPALSGTDAWHYRKGYVKGPRATEAYLWCRHTGYAGHLSSNYVEGR